MQSDALRVVSAVAHELRSPLTSVRGYSALLLKQWDVIEDDDRKAMVAQVDRDARRIQRLIGELLDISRLETGKVNLNRTQLRVPELTAAVIQSVTIAYPDLEVHAEFPDNLPSVWADGDRVTQVLTNLLENACKYASPKGIEVFGQVSDNFLSVSVKDQGEGIPQSDLDQLFTQFFKSRTGKPTGTGLGLWISRGLMEAHGGTLDASSSDDGTTVMFRLPLRAFEELHGE